MRGLTRDVQHGLRLLARNPAFTAVVVLTLGVAIGINTAIFSLFDAALNLHYPVKDQDQLANLWAVNLPMGASRNPLSIPDFLDYRQQNRVFEDVAAYQGESYRLTNVPEPRRVSAAQVSCNYFEVLGVQPAMGRTFLPEECRAGGHHAVILSHGLWQGSFGADSRILSGTITLNRETYTVVGVMPAGFRLFSGEADLWVPLALDSSALSRGVRQVMAIGRLKAGVTGEQAQAGMNILARGLEQAYPDTNKGWGIRIIRLSDEINKRLTVGLVFIMGPVVFVLLIACANVANLLLARASVREKEMAVRAALGAGRLRLVRQLLTESGLFSILGAALGLLLGFWGMAVLRTLFHNIVQGSAGALRLDARVLGFALILCLLTPLLFGLAPALYGSKLNLNETMKEGGRGSRAAGGSHRLREWLVVSEVALAVALLGLSGLLIRVGIALENVKPGFDPKNLLTMTISLPEVNYPQNSEVADFFHKTLEQIERIPGVETVGLVDRLPVFGGDRGPFQPVSIEGRAGTEVQVSAAILRVSPGYLPALRIPLRRGRALTEQDRFGAAPVALVSESLARAWRGEDPIGHRVRLGSQDPKQPWLTVVGVVGDVINDRGRPLPHMYVSSAQNPERAMALVVRTMTAPIHLAEPAKCAVWTVDKDQPVEDIQTMEQRLSEQVGQAYIMIGMLAAFAVLALVLAAVGVYSVMSYVVAQRTHEIGVRMALGARPRDAFRLVAKQAMVLIASGLLVGLAGSFAGGRILGHELRDVSPSDPVIFLSVSALLALVALVACYLPARRAMKVDPLVALRYE